MKLDVLAGKMHGENGTYDAGCRCEPCTFAHACWYRDRMNQANKRNPAYQAHRRALHSLI